MKRKIAVNADDTKITINDVAKACGVSKTTISRYLNHKYDGFSDETRARISETISRMGYNPNRVAQRLKSSRSGIIGCSIGNISSPFAGLLLKGIINECENEGFQVMFTECDEDPKKEVAAIDGLLANRVDGLIVNTSGRNDDYLLTIAERGVPIVLADRGLLGEKKLDTVEHMNEEMAYECVRILKNYGYEKVAFFSHGNGSVAPRVNRHKGFCMATKEFYSGTEPEYYEFSVEDETSCIMVVKAFRETNRGKRIAILSANGVTAQSIALAFSSLGWSFGYEYGMCTFDDWDWMKLTAPGITSVSIPTEEIGAKTAKLLISIIKGTKEPGDSPQYIRLPGIINIRGSTARE